MRRNKSFRLLSVIMDLEDLKSNLDMLGYELGEAAPELGSGVFLPLSYLLLQSADPSIYIPMLAFIAPMDILCGYVIYKGILRGGLADRLGQPEFDILKNIYEGINKRLRKGATGSD